MYIPPTVRFTGLFLVPSDFKSIKCRELTHEQTALDSSRRVCLGIKWVCSPRFQTSSERWDGDLSRCDVQALNIDIWKPKRFRCIKFTVFTNATYMCIPFPKKRQQNKSLLWYLTLPKLLIVLFIIDGIL